jgi:hypothetical protein
MIREKNEFIPLPEGRATIHAQGRQVSEVSPTSRPPAFGHNPLAVWTRDRDAKLVLSLSSAAWPGWLHLAAVEPGHDLVRKQLGILDRHLDRREYILDGEVWSGMPMPFQ